MSERDILWRAAPLAPTRPDGSPWPRISIVTPSYNQGQFIEETIRSVLLQGYPNLEYIIVDGGSTDSSVGIIKKYSDYLHHWVNERDSGHGNALNKGFERSTGEIMCWLNSDDMYLPWTFRIVADIFTSYPQVNWITGLNAWWSDHGVLTAARRAPKNIYDYLLGNYAWIQQESVFWRRSLWERAGGHINENYRLMIDGELWSRFFLQDSLFIVDCILSGYRVHSTNRAQKYLTDCQAEMITIISDMRRDCADSILRTADSLARVKLFKRMLPCQHLNPIDQVARLVCRTLYARASYPLLSYRNGVWAQSRLPFSV
ncbi:MAG: glycosyltransferase family 2 protein [Ktedonobacteraceae bacterium]